MSTTRVWLTGAPPPDEAPKKARDDQGRTWQPADGQWHTADNRHHESWTGLTARTDLVELLEAGR